MSQSLTRGFLFADLRGYTSYLEKRGAVAGASLLDRFRGVVRGAVARYGGAEIRTEGDSFYVVFPSASTAVACALDIIRESVAKTDGETSIPVGVGVHAGEALETDEGLVGTAVNIAARLAAIAGPGEVLVSDTVRSLTRSVGDAVFVRAGTRTLKGVDEPIAVYRAMPAGAVLPRQRRMSGGQAYAALVAVGALAALALIAVVWSGWLASPGSSAAPPSLVSIATTRGTESAAATSPTPQTSVTVASPSPVRTAVRTAGPAGFATNTFAVTFRVDLGPDWLSVVDQTDLAVFERRRPPVGWIDIILVAATLDPPCFETTPAFIADRPADLMEWLATRTWLRTANPQPYNLGSYVGRAVDIEILDTASAPCDTNTTDAQLFRLGGVGGDGSFWGAELGERKRMIAVDVEGQTVTFVIGSPFDDVELLWAVTEPRLQDVRFLTE